MTNEPTLLPFDAWLWGLDDERLSALTLGGLARACAEDGVKLPQLTFLAVIAEHDDAFDVLRRVGGDAVLGSRSSGGGALLLARVGLKDFVVSVWDAPQPGVKFIVATPPSTDNAWRRVEKAWLRDAAPALARVFLNRSDFEHFGDALSEHGTVEVYRLTARVLEDRSSYTRGWKDEIARRPTHRQALAETDAMLVRTLSLRIGDRLKLHLRRHAGATFYSGDFPLFHDVVLQRLGAAAGARRELLSDRERKPSEPITSSLVMALPEHALATQAEREQLLESVSSVRGAQLAVYHRNPYLHFAVTDFLDGSNFDVFVTDDSQLRVVPGYHASVGSLARITDRMGDVLGMISLEREASDELIPDEEFFVS